MKILKPFYYDDFKCIADKCIDSCCIGWRISIDKESYKKYKRVNGEFGKYLKTGINRIRENNNNLFYGVIKLKNNRCIFLDENNLCNIYINLGEKYLCNTCKCYPRIIEKYGEIYEKNLTMSCPEVARYLVKFKDDFYFNMDEEEVSDLDKDYVVNKSYDEKLYNLLWSSRSLAIEIIQFKEISIWKRIVFLKMLCDKIQKRIDENKFENYQQLLNNFRYEIVNIDTINSLDKITIRPDIKMPFTKSILQLRNDFGIKNEQYLKLIDEYNELVKENNADYLMIEIENEFNEFLCKYANIFENLLIYLIYRYFMRALYTKDLEVEINKVIISYAVIKILLLARWYKNDKTLNEKEFVEIFYLFSRVIEHTSGFLDKLYNNVKEAGYDSIAYLTILVR